MADMDHDVVDRDFNAAPGQLDDRLLGDRVAGKFQQDEQHVQGTLRYIDRLAVAKHEALTRNDPPAIAEAILQHLSLVAFGHTYQHFS